MESIDIKNLRCELDLSQERFATSMVGTFRDSAPTARSAASGTRLLCPLRGLKP